MKLINPLLLLGAFGGVVSVFPSVVSAQAGQEVEGNARRLANGQNRLGADYQVRVLRVRNINASIMAYWLDPIHNEEPYYFRADTERNAFMAAQEGKSLVRDKDAELAKWQERFPGLQAVTPQDERNQILVVGTAESFAKVEAELAVLDKPFQQVEMEAQFVETAAENIRELGLRNFNFNPEKAAQNQFDMAVGTADSELKVKLDALVAQGKAKIATAPRVTLISGFFGSIGTGNAVPATVGIKDENGRFRELNAGATGTASPQLLLNMQSNLLAKATVNKDETISLYIEPSRKLNLAVSNQELPLQTIERRQAAINLQDGDAVALSGVTYAGTVRDMIDGAKGKNVILIVTARIIRRAGD